MARKSMVRDIRDIFENDSNNPTMKDSDEKFQCTKNKKSEDQLNNKELHKSAGKSVSCKYPGKEQSKKPNYKTNASHYGTLRDKIDKFNIQSPKAKTGTSIAKEPMHSNIATQRLSKHSDFVESLKSNRASNDKIKSNINKFDANNFEKMVSDNQAKLQPLNNNIDAKTENTKKEIELSKTTNFLKKVNEINTTELTNKPKLSRTGPSIASKPKYINKIKPHPDMPLKAKNQLLEKIKIFNDLVDKESKNITGTDPEEHSQNINGATGYSSLTSNKKPLPFPKKVAMNKPATPVLADHSEENLCDVTLGNRKNFKLSPKKPSKENLHKMTPYSNNVSSGLKPILRKNSDYHLYDVIDNSNLNVKDFRSVLKSNSDKNVYDVVVNKNLSKTNPPSKLIQGKSLEILEDDGYAVVEGSNTSTEKEKNYESVESDSSSEEEMATEYDVIENLNVTKVTVERRYNIPDNNKQDSTFNIRRETYYDHNLNPRIERISRGTQRNQENSNTSDNTYIKKSLLIVQELLQSELAYFKGLLKVYEDYIVYFKESPHLCTPNIWKVFGNFEEIYKRQIEFYAQLTQCNNDMDYIGETFLKNESMFNLYEYYIINRYASNKYLMGECCCVIQARDKELGNKLNLDCYLLTPFQRLLRYRLLLKNLKEALENENTPSSKLDEAVIYLENFIEGTNMHAKVLQGIQNSPINLLGRGKLLMIDDCFIRNNGKKYRSTVILFESIIIFTRKTESETYVFKNCINLSDLYIRSITEDLTSFQLQNFTEYRLKHDNKHVFDVEVSDPKSKQEWVKKIESLLWNQFAAHKQT